ncbi:MAG TPA: CoA pyrophosphatase [Bacteroidales bacterium]|nr:CoA pyrophosphatase [Bacteroidales bacterium]
MKHEIIKQHPDIIDFTDFLKVRLSKELPGKQAHFRMIPSVRLSEFDPIPENARKSSVLLLLFEKNGHLFTILIQRPEYNGVHSAQISFPGGSFEERDISLENTALRETEEEIGIDRKRVSIIGSLTDLYIPPSNYRIKPFVAFGSSIEKFTPDQREVQEIHTVDINEFAGNKNIKSKKIRIRNGMEYDTFYYDINGLTIWGATAMILSEFAELYGEFLHINNYSTD